MEFVVSELHKLVDYISATVEYYREQLPEPFIEKMNVACSRLLAVTTDAEISQKSFIDYQDFVRDLLDEMNSVNEAY